MATLKKIGTSRQNILFDGSQKLNRVVCASCKVPFDGQKKVLNGVDEDGYPLLICRDCQRLIPWEDDIVDPWDHSFWP